MKKKLVSFMLILSMILSLGVTAGAVYSANSIDAPEHLIYEDGSISDATLADVDLLTQKRSQAIFNGDEKAAEDLLLQLQEIGGRPSTQEEIALFVSPNELAASGTGDIAMPTKVTKYMTYSYTTTVNGKTYEVKRVDNVASTSSNLYHNGVIAKKTSANKSASTFQAIVSSAITWAGNSATQAASKAMSVYSIVGSIVEAISPTTVVKDINATYTYQIQEYCSFYSYKNSSGNWVSFARASYADTVVTVVMLSVTPSGGTTMTLNNCTATYKNKFYGENSNPNNTTKNISNLLKNFLSTNVIDSKSLVTSVTIYSDGTNVVRRIGLVAPSSTSEIN